MPKVELHLHLEGAAPPAFIRGLAKEKQVDMSGIFDETGAYRFTDFWDFLKVYEAATSVLQSPEDYARLMLAVLEESAASGVVYGETFLSPDFCGGRDIGAWREYLHAMQRGGGSGRAADGRHPARDHHLHPAFRAGKGARDRPLCGGYGGGLDRRFWHCRAMRRCWSRRISAGPSTARARRACG